MDVSLVDAKVSEVIMGRKNLIEGLNRYREIQWHVRDNDSAIFVKTITNQQCQMESRALLVVLPWQNPTNSLTTT